ncbi:uncharacterized protein HMPREF1541_10651 [Cyphellophora europaea CBS 101466]|uniref:DUF6923 domain-containing protein n=1 Tax=Cyphellophora europaea (strain CBS 101466) TaxID=1220924 RepID=W2S5W0_CYPE1|nr:uncharacterized protein HMPREF1541_10651 [Cyphellophora europaea CBS 101466]ETN44101.1 hypothetical protein HMPREF1541_10651 [Cyphellophora europaea CBS 101466]
MYDWAYVPTKGNYLWTVAADTSQPRTSQQTYLMRFDRTAKTWFTVGSFGVLVNTGTNTWGAVYASADGFLYGSENNSGRIFRFNVTSVQATSLATGPGTSVNDGAHWYVMMLDIFCAEYENF